MEVRVFLIVAFFVNRVHHACRLLNGEVKHENQAKKKSV
jgi:hypothetical protein